MRKRVWNVVETLGKGILFKYKAFSGDCLPSLQPTKIWVHTSTVGCVQLEGIFPRQGFWSGIVQMQPVSA